MTLALVWPFVIFILPGLSQYSHNHLSPHPQPSVASRFPSLFCKFIGLIPHTWICLRLNEPYFIFKTHRANCYSEEWLVMGAYLWSGMPKYTTPKKLVKMHQGNGRARKRDALQHKSSLHNLDGVRACWAELGGLSGVTGHWEETRHSCTGFKRKRRLSLGRWWESGCNSLSRLHNCYLPSFYCSLSTYANVNGCSYLRMKGFGYTPVLHTHFHIRHHFVRVPLLHSNKM